VNQFVATIALIGIVIIVASLSSGLIERVGLPLVAGFLLLGAALGPSGLNIIDIQLGSPVLQVLATLGLALVLFSDAVGVDTLEIRERRRLVLTMLGPGTVLPAVVIGAAGYWVLQLPVALAAILGAAIASTDPVLLRAVLRSPALSSTARVALRLESGMNDVVLLPIVVIAIIALQRGASMPGMEVGKHLMGLFILGPALGALIGWAGIMMLATVRDKIGVRRDYESMYALGLGFAAFAAAEAVGGSGFLAAFAAGLAIASLDVELCDCFLEYGEATAEMLLLLTFVAFGTSLIWTGFSALDLRTGIFAVIALMARTVVLFPVLSQVGIRGRDRRIIALFGPRGLSSLLLVLLPVFAGIPGAERLFIVTCLVVVLSLVLHGTIIGLFLRGSAANAPVEIKRAAPVVAPEIPLRIGLDEVASLRAAGEEITIVDVRASWSFKKDTRRAVGALRVLPDDVVRSAQEVRLSHHGTVVVFCA
jgi:NhaP-type Na+/H+ or K+/H+ antiporter